MSDALEAIRNDDFDTGIQFFSDLVKDRPDYHIAWLRLGHARREKAVRLTATDPEAAVDMLMDSLSDLERAMGHVDTYYKALAHYERSKTAYRLNQLNPPSLIHSSSTSDEPMKSLALNEALEACNLSTERKYHTWFDYLQNVDHHASMSLKPPSEA